MDTSNSLINVCVIQLRESVHPEDQELAKQHEAILNALLAKMMPILRYICAPQNFMNSPGVRSAKVCTMNNPTTWLYMNDCGKFFSAHQSGNCSSPTVHYVGHSNTGLPNTINNGDESWTRIPFLDLINNLQKLMVESERKKEEHLRSVKERRELLDQLLQVIETSK